VAKCPVAKCRIGNDGIVLTWDEDVLSSGPFLNPDSSIRIHCSPDSLCHGCSVVYDETRCPICFKRVVPVDEYVDNIVDEKVMTPQQSVRWNFDAPTLSEGDVLLLVSHMADNHRHVMQEWGEGYRCGCGFYGSGSGMASHIETNRPFLDHIARAKLIQAAQEPVFIINADSVTFNTNPAPPLTAAVMAAAIQGLAAVQPMTKPSAFTMRGVHSTYNALFNSP